MDFVAIVSIVILFVVLRTLWWWFAGRKLPKYPPLEIDEDDPAMRAAKESARDSLRQFRAMFDAGTNETRVRIALVKSPDQVEHVWADVLKLADTSLTVRYLASPLSRTVKSDRIHEHPLSDIEDWVAVTKTGEIHGGYTQRVVFERRRDQWGRLPRELEQQAARYVAKEPRHP